MIDSHCHLADRKFAADLSGVISQANAAGVTHMVTIADDVSEAEKCRQLAEKYDQLFYTVGVHPHAAKEWNVEHGKSKVLECAQDKKMVAVGEIGLDYHYMNSPKDDQIRAFYDQIVIAQELNFPIVVHNRESFEDLLSIIDELKPTAMVLHCCTEEWANAKKLIELGYLLGFTGIATYPKSVAIREVIKQCPLKQMMIETDAPYLAPEGRRGERCEPAMVTEVAKCIADIKGVSLQEVDRITTKNTMDFYRLSPDILAL
ncbi:TatD family hydrolase [Candidatus Peribacteria bacterium]|nr:TatD family hydrolase [Candidatus Peribacteria bacterium]